MLANMMAVPTSPMEASSDILFVPRRIRQRCVVFLNLSPIACTAPMMESSGVMEIMKARPAASLINSPKDIANEMTSILGDEDHIGHMLRRNDHGPISEVSIIETCDFSVHIIMCPSIHPFYSHNHSSR